MPSRNLAVVKALLAAARTLSRDLTQIDDGWRRRLDALHEEIGVDAFDLEEGDHRHAIREVGSSAGRLGVLNLILLPPDGPKLEPCPDCPHRRETSRDGNT